MTFTALCQKFCYFWSVFLKAM